MKHAALSGSLNSRPRFRAGRLLAIPIIVALASTLSGCAGWTAPTTVDTSDLAERAVTEAVRDVSLRASVLGAQESRRIFGADVNGAGIQPVWIEVRNSSPDTLWLLRAGTDPDYFSPLEVAWSFHTPMASTQNAAIDEHFEVLDFANPIPPESTRSGIIFTNPHHRTRVLNVDLLGPEKLIPFTLFLPDPDNPPDQTASQVVVQQLEAAHEDIQDVESFRDRLRRMPCNAGNREKKERGDPLNLVLVGRLADLAAALVRRGFRSDRITFDDKQRLFARPPDFVMRKAGRADVPSHWLRGWVAPFRFEGLPVFLAQVGRPVGGRLAVDQDNRHRLHADVDETRNLLVQDLMYSGGLAKLGFSECLTAQGVQSQTNLARDEFRTDGARAVMFFVTRPRSLAEMELLDWIRIPGQDGAAKHAEPPNGRN